MLRTLQHVGGTILDALTEHPRLALGCAAVGALGLVLLADGSHGGFLPAGSKGALPLPSGPLPAGTTGLTSRLSNAYFTGIHDLAAHFRSRGSKIDGEALLAVFEAESGNRANIPNRANGVCVGLNQICPKALKKGELDPERVNGLRAVGFQGSRAEYSALREEEQLPFVKAYFDNQNAYRAITDYGMLYLVNFSPAFLAPPSAGIWEGRYPIMYKRNGGGRLDGSYTDNASVDSGGKGYIELADMSKFVLRAVNANKPKWDEMRMRLARATVNV